MKKGVTFTEHLLHARCSALHVTYASSMVRPHKGPEKGSRLDNVQQEVTFLKCISLVQVRSVHAVTHHGATEKNVKAVGPLMRVEATTRGSTRKHSST